MLSIALRPVSKGIREGHLEVMVKKEVRADTEDQGRTENEDALPRGHSFRRAGS